MATQVQGIINGKYIELDREPNIPSGARVIIEIQSKPLSLVEKRRLVDQLCGSWASDPSLKAIFADIEAQRAITQPREVDFGATP